MRYLNEERFIVNSNDKQSLKNYHDNYDRIFGKPEAEKCTGFYDDGVMPTACQNREGCGLEGCPAADFGNTYDNPSAPAPQGTDAIEMRFVTITHFCNVCQAYVPDPENHQHHAIINEP